ncbi:CHASE domain-containing protein [soil metagenome]
MRRFLPLTVFLTIGLIGLVGASTAWLAVERAERVRFAAVADEAANRVRARIAQHEMLIAATAAYFEASHETVTTGSFDTYFGMLGLDALSPGISHLGFAPLGTVAEAEALAVEYGATGFRPFVIWPEPIEATVAPITLLGATGPVPSGMIGFDMHSEPRRRVAMEAAIQARAPRATEPIAIMPGEEARAGFIVFAPVYTPRMERVMRISTQHYPAGFVFAGFRTSDLLQAALHVEPILPVHVTLRDAAESRTTVRETAVYAYGRQPDPGYGQDFAELRPLAVAGRVWQAELRPTAGFRPGSGRALSIGLLVAALVLAGTIAFSLREQARARSAAEVLAAATQRNLGEKDMMLQEMKHRIKNAIARILGIARQTAAHSSDIESFSSSFTQRLQAMAAAQAVLTRSRYQRAELHALLSR